MESTRFQYCTDCTLSVLVLIWWAKDVESYIKKEAHGMTTGGRGMTTYGDAASCGSGTKWDETSMQYCEAGGRDGRETERRTASNVDLNGHGLTW